MEHGCGQVSFMRSQFAVLVCFSLLLFVAGMASPSSPSPLLGDLLTQAWEADRNNQPEQAASFYRQALQLQPNSPLLHLKYAEMMILLDRKDEAGRHLAQALALMHDDPLVPPDLKRYICDLLMGRLTPELLRGRVWLGYDYEGWLFPAPFTTLSKEEQQRLTKLVPKEWLFPDKASEAWFLLSIGEREKGLTLLREVVMEGGVDTPIHFVMSSLVPSDQRSKVAEEWLRDAERTGNPFLWVAALHLLQHTQQIDTFRKALPKALTALKDRKDLLAVIADLCEQMRWAEGIKQVRALLPPLPKPADRVELSRGLHQALEEGDLAKTKEWIRLIAAEFPEVFQSIVLSSTAISRMLAHQWHELVLEIARPEIVAELPQDAKEVLLLDAAFNPARFSYWMRLFLSRPVGDAREYGINLLSTLRLANGKDPERVIWLLEQGLLIFPNEPRLREQLAAAYNQAGYPHRAAKILQELLLEQAQAGVADSSLLTNLWQMHRFPPQRRAELLTWLETHRSQLPLNLFPKVAQLLLSDGHPEKALEWLDEALRIAEERGWSGDEEIHAKLYPLRHAYQLGEPFEQWRREVSRTQELFNPRTYLLRIQCLVDLRRVEEAKKVLERAQQLYPDFPFAKESPVAQKLLFKDWVTEWKQLADEWRQKGVPDYRLLLRLAYATVKVGRANEASQIADELMAGQPHWREGFLRAVALFEQRIAALVPFIRWVQSMIGRGMSWLSWLKVAGDTHFALSQLEEPSLASAFMIATILLMPSDNTEMWVDTNLVMQYVRWDLLSPEEQKALVEVLSKERLNQYALNQMRMMGYMISPYDGRGLRAPMEQLQQTQRHSAHALICQMVQNVATASREQVREWLRALEQADWTDVNWCPLGMMSHVNFPHRLAQRGFREEAVQLLQLALRHAPENQKATLLARLAELGGEIRLPENTRNSKAWLTHAKAMWQAHRNEEAKEAALKALSMPLSAADQAELMELLARIDPVLALRHLRERLPNFLFDDDPLTDPPLHFQRVVSALFLIAEQRKDLAPEVEPLLERTISFSPWLRLSYCYELALVLFWSKKPLQAIAALFEPLDKGRVDGHLWKILKALLRVDLSSEDHRRILQHLEGYVRSHPISLSLWAEELSWVGENRLLESLRRGEATEEVQSALNNMVSLAHLLRQIVEANQVVIPREFLEKALWRVKNLATFSKEFGGESLVPQPVIEAWWQLFETAVWKSVRSPEDAKSLHEWLHPLWVERPSTDFARTVWYERLKKLAEALAAKARQ